MNRVHRRRDGIGVQALRLRRRAPGLHQRQPLPTRPGLLSPLG
jgi:hypothetical protein